MHRELCGQASNDGLYHVITKDYVYVDIHRSRLDWEIKCIPRPFFSNFWTSLGTSKKQLQMCVHVGVCMYVCECVRMRECVCPCVHGV